MPEFPETCPDCGAVCDYPGCPCIEASEPEQGTVETCTLCGNIYLCLDEARMCDHCLHG